MVSVLHANDRSLFTGDLAAYQADYLARNEPQLMCFAESITIVPDLFMQSVSDVKAAQARIDAGGSSAFC